mmetsp:Transcript_35261/g.111448  ORF Transcript_35261/g.111448 Transcript_35261/m.111448 type:complete len:243 (+) Transcript_35261:1517-2245(+)
MGSITVSARSSTWICRSRTAGMEEGSLYDVKSLALRTPPISASFFLLASVSRRRVSAFLIFSSSICFSRRFSSAVAPCSSERRWLSSTLVLPVALPSSALTLGFSSAPPSSAKKYATSDHSLLHALVRISAPPSAPTIATSASCSAYVLVSAASGSWRFPRPTETLKAMPARTSASFLGPISSADSRNSRPMPAPTFLVRCSASSGISLALREAAAASYTAESLAPGRRASMAAACAARSAR